MSATGIASAANCSEAPDFVVPGSQLEFWGILVGSDSEINSPTAQHGQLRNALQTAHKKS
jgi:hypothetical protein